MGDDTQNDVATAARWIVPAKDGTGTDAGSHGVVIVENATKHHTTKDVKRRISHANSSSRTTDFVAKTPPTLL